jgi:hypothetical protein
MASDISKLTVPIRQLANVLTIEPNQIRKLSKEGILPPPVSHGIYPLATSVAAYIKHMRSDRRFGSPGSRFSEARTKRMEELAKKAALDRMAREGQLVEIDGLMKSVDIIFQAFRTRLLAFPTKYAPRLTNDARKNFQVLTDAAYECLEELSQITLVAKDEPAKSEAAE